jgi:phytol kinase
MNSAGSASSFDDRDIENASCKFDRVISTHSGIDERRLDKAPSMIRQASLKQVGEYWHFCDEFDAYERRFVIWSCAGCVSLMFLCVILSFTMPDWFGTFHVNMLWNFLAVFVVEVVWKLMLACAAYRYIPRYKRTINYTRKLGNLVKLYKYFLAEDYLPDVRKEPLSLLFIFAADQLLFIVMFAHNVRKRDNPISKFCRFLFIQQDRHEDRPDTLIYQVTEDILRFAVYLPFKLFILREYFPDHQSVIYIPLTVNSIGDGLAEPVGVFFSTWFRKHLGWDVTYTTKSLYTSEGGFWSGKFRRSYPGSACVFIVTVIVLLIEHAEFSHHQLVYLLSMMPYWMTMTEAYAPHTNDGPFLALVGCGLLVIAFTLL